MTSSSRTEPPGWITARHARLRRGVDAVAEREERVRREHGPLQVEPGVGGLPHGDLRAVHAAHLTGADAEHGSVPRQRMAFDFTPKMAAHANARSSASASVGARSVTTFQS